MNLGNCPRCGKLYTVNIRELCPECMKVIEKEYEKCATFLREQKVQRFMRCLRLRKYLCGKLRSSSRKAGSRLRTRQTLRILAKYAER